MPTYYVRPVTGSDANNGLAPSSAWQTLTGNFSILQPGDEVRVEQSPDPQLVHANSPWTFGSNTITIPVQLVLNIFLCESPFTGPMASGVLLGTSSNRKQGNVSASITVPNSTSGPLAYRTLTTINPSAYRQICFWIQSSTALPAACLALEFCSDSSGTTPSVSFTVPHPLPANRWVPVVVASATLLPTAINSIRLTALQPLPATILLLDDIVVAKDPSAADAITLHSLVGRGPGSVADLYFPIRSLTQSGSSTIVVFDAHIDHSAAVTTTARVPFASGNGPVYHRRTLILPAALTPNVTSTTQPLRTPWGNITKSGVFGQPIRISGGWDSATMSSIPITGVSTSILNGITGEGEGLRFNGNRFVIVERLGFFNYRRGVVVDGQLVQLLDMRCYRTREQSCTVETTSAVMPSAALSHFHSVGSDAPAISIRDGAAVFNVLRVHSVGDTMFHHGLQIGQADDRQCQLEVNRGYIWDVGTSVFAAKSALLRGVDVSVLQRDPSVVMSWIGGTAPNPIVTWCDCQFGTATSVATSPAMDGTGYQTRFHQPNGSLTLHRIFAEQGTVVPDMVTFFTPPRSWRIQPNGKAREHFPLIIPLGPVWRTSTTAVQVRVRRSNANIRVRIRIVGGQIPTISTNEQGLWAEDTGPINTWNLITLSLASLFSSGVFDLQAEIWTTDGNATYNAWIDSIL